MTPAVRQLAEAMPETELQEAVRQLCADLGLWHYHPRYSARSTPGWPDSVIIGPAKLIFAELKSETGRLSGPQRDVARRLQRAGQSWRLWRPSDLLSGRIGRELAGLAAVQGELFPRSA